MTFQVTVGKSPAFTSTFHSSLSSKPSGHGGGIKSITAILVCLVISLGLFLNRQSPNLSRVLLRLHITTLKTCILYDRPPATFSASISWTLTKCMEHRNYGRQKSYRRVPENQLIVKMLRQSYGSPVTSLVSKRFSLTRKSVNLLQEHCANIIYITSTRPMKERLLSKYGGGDRVDVDKLKITEKYYEKFPNIDSSPSSVSDLLPNYVIRSSSYYQDMKALLHAFKCMHVQMLTHPDDLSSATDLSMKMKQTVELKDLKFKSLSALAAASNNRTLDLVDKLFK